MNLKNKKILVTGADGFIGSHLVEHLITRCSGIRALSQYNSFQFYGWLEDSPVRDEIEIVSGDIRDPGLCRELMHGVDVVFHLAALIGIPYSYRAPESYIQTNVIGTLNLLEASKEEGVGRFLQTSTSEVYGTARSVPMTEHHPLNPQSPYAASKVGADALALSYHKSFSLPVVVVRPFNTFGPRQSIRAVLPTIITQALSGAQKIRLGKLSPTRDFTYVLDTCEAMKLLAGCDDAVGEVVQIGRGVEVSIGSAVKLILEILNRKDMKIETEEDRLRPEASEVDRLICDASRLEELTEYQPLTSFQNGLKNMVQWFSDPNNLSRYDSNRYGV